jgi:hypothetical protein
LTLPKNIWSFDFAATCGHLVWYQVVHNRGVVDGRDLGLVLSQWGDQVNGTDVDGSGIVTAEDLCMLLAQWGPCTP